MRLEDNMMPVLTGLVFAVVLGTTAQNSDDIMRMFGGDTELQVADDVFFVRAGNETTLDVLANDYAGGALDVASIQIVSGPSCGEATPTAGGISYGNSEACEGPVSFTYCLEDAGACTPGEVTMNVRPSPVAVVTNTLPEKGELVPLALKPRSNMRQAPQLEDGAVAPIRAYVVSFDMGAGPLPSADLSKADEIARLMTDASASDLDRAPVSDVASLPGSVAGAIPLSAELTSRFLADYAADGSVVTEELETTNVSPVILEDAASGETTPAL